MTPEALKVDLEEMVVNLTKGREEAARAELVAETQLKQAQATTAFWMGRLHCAQAIVAKLNEPGPEPQAAKLFEILDKKE